MLQGQVFISPAQRSGRSRPNYADRAQLEFVLCPLSVANQDAQTTPEPSARGGLDRIAPTEPNPAADETSHQGQRTKDNRPNKSNWKKLEPGTLTRNLEAARLLVSA